MKKIIATDFDGTLNQGGIQPHVVEAIERFRKAGNLFGVVTGRDRGGSIDAFLAEKKFGFDFVLALNGAMAFDGEGNHLYSIAIDGSRPVGDTTLSRALLRRVWVAFLATKGASISIRVTAEFSSFLRTILYMIYFPSF